jgi:hypothetical protein
MLRLDKPRPPSFAPTGNGLLQFRVAALIVLAAEAAVNPESRPGYLVVNLSSPFPCRPLC